MSVDNKISFLIFGKTGSTPKQFTLSKFFLLLAIVAALVGSGVSGYLIIDYIQLRDSITAKQMLEKEVHRQQDEIITQRQQIQYFAEELNSLKSKIDELKELENQVRLLAKLDDDSAEDDTFGLGGPMPVDLNSRIALSETHDELVSRMSVDIDHLEKESDTRGQRLKNLLESLEKKLALLAHTPSVLPVNGRLTSSYGRRKSPFNGRNVMHSGLDIGAPHGTPIRATADGVVKFAGRKGPLGLLVIINHNNGLETYYAHCSKLLKKKGARVSRGDKIALVGSTGRSTGAHVHYEIRRNGNTVNPKEYVLKQ
jgi:murein DD-endopeptidase MepM/ murein hydrolase activator NlpD